MAAPANLGTPVYAGQAEAKPRVTLRTLAAKKKNGEKIVSLTAYDASFAALLDASGVDLMLVGDSLGNVIQGHSSTLPVTVDQIAYHTACVARGTQRAMLAADMPFASYPEPKLAFENAAKLMGEGAAIVKLEGAGHVLASIEYLVHRDIPVCAHLGLTPQSVHKLGGYRVQGRDEDSAAQLKREALEVQSAGAGLLVLEMVPATLAAEITQSLQIPTIGIGAGVDCDGQILVVYDLLGITPGKRPRFAQNFLAGRGSIAEAVDAYVSAVREKRFPSAEQSY